MPSGAINQLTAPDAYTTQSTIDPGSWLDHVVISSVNQSIVRQVKIAPPGQPPGAAYWDVEVNQAPGSQPVYRARLCGVRVRAAIKLANLPAGSSQAVVTVEAVAP